MNYEFPTTREHGKKAEMSNKDTPNTTIPQYLEVTKSVKSLSVFLLYFAFFTFTTIAQSPKAEFYRHSPRIFPSTEVAESDFSNYDVTFYGLDIEFFPQTQNLAGYVDIGFTFTQTSQNFKVALFPPLGIDSVRIEGLSEPQFSQQDERNWIHTIELGQEFPSGHSMLVRVYYSGEPDQSYESIVFSENAGQPHIWTLSEPYGAMHWFPLKNVPSDKADSAYITITVPDPLFVASNGLLEATTVLPENRTRYEWKTRYPIAMYLISLAIGDFQIFEDTIQIGEKAMPFVNYVYKEFNPTEFLSAVNKTKPMLPYFGEIFGEYPFIDEKYGHASFEFRGGMEHQTLSSMGTFNESIIAHELVHQWFGNTVTCKSFEHIWINEGFATYGEGLWVEQTLGKQAFLEWRTDLISLVNNSSSGTVVKPSPTADFENGSHVNTIFNYRLSYAKGAMVVHGLRTLLGDSVFFEASKTLVQETYRHQSIDTEQLKSHYEGYFGESLDSYFAEWVYGAGFPSFSGNFESRSNGASFTTKLVIEQRTQGTNILFETPFDIQFSNDFEDTTVTISMQERTQRFEFDFDFPPHTAIMGASQDFLISVQSLSLAPVDEDIGYLPRSTNIRSVYPNPFNPSTTISFELSRSGRVHMEIVDLSGRVLETVLDDNLKMGVHELRISMQNYASGTYFLRLQRSTSGNEKPDTKKIFLVK